MYHLNHNKDTKEENEEPAQVNNNDQDGQYFFELPGPPASIYYSKEDLLNSVRSFAMEHGYVIVVRRSEKEKKKNFKCDRSVLAFSFFFSEFNSPGLKWKCYIFPNFFVLKNLR